MLALITILLGVQLFFLIQWAMGEHATGLKGTKTTRENLPKAYIVEIAQKVVVCFIAIGVASAHAEAAILELEELAGYDPEEVAMWNNVA